MPLRANQLPGGEQPDVLDTLAAAYAEAGRFPEALATAPKPWTWPIDKTTTLWWVSYGLGSHCTKRESPIIKHHRLPHPFGRHLDLWRLMAPSACSAHPAVPQ